MKQLLLETPRTMSWEGKPSPQAALRGRTDPWEERIHGRTGTVLQLGSGHSGPVTEDITVISCLPISETPPWTSLWDTAGPKLLAHR